MSKKHENLDTSGLVIRSSGLPKLPPGFDFRNVPLLEAALKANIALAELNGLVISIPNFEVLLQPLTVREAVASSEIENIFTDTIDLLQAELMQKNDLPQAQKETLRYKQALLKGNESVKKYGFLSTNHIVEIQRELEPSKSGIRKLPGTVIANSLGEIIYTPPQGEAEIRNLMANWETYCNENHEQVDTLIRMAILHYQFESIHPFYDGNGRTGRIIMILQLVMEGRLRFPVLFLSGYILKTKVQYYHFLQTVRTKEEWDKWVLYILKGVELQAKETSGRIVAIKDLQAKFKTESKKKAAKIYSAELLDYFFSKAFYTQKDLTKEFNLNRKTAGKYLNTLFEIGLLKQEIIKKEKLYFIQDFIELLS